MPSQARNGSRMPFGLEYRADHQNGRLAHGPDPVDQPRRRPLEDAPDGCSAYVLDGAVKVRREAAQMRSDAFATLDGAKKPGQQPGVRTAVKKFLQLLGGARGLNAPTIDGCE
jgi:hypothetical protein